MEIYYHTVRLIAALKDVNEKRQCKLNYIASACMKKLNSNS